MSESFRKIVRIVAKLRALVWGWGWQGRALRALVWGWGWPGCALRALVWGWGWPGCGT